MTTLIIDIQNKQTAHLDLHKAPFIGQFAEVGNIINAMLGQRLFILRYLPMTMISLQVDNSSQMAGGAQTQQNIGVAKQQSGLPQAPLEQKHYDRSTSGSISGIIQPTKCANSNLHCVSMPHVQAFILLQVQSRSCTIRAV